MPDRIQRFISPIAWGLAVILAGQLLFLMIHRHPLTGLKVPVVPQWQNLAQGPSTQGSNINNALLIAGITNQQTNLANAIRTNANNTNTVAVTTNTVAVTTNTVAATTNTVAATTNAVAATTNAVAATTNAVAATTNAVAATTNAVAATTNAVAATTNAVAATTNAVAATTNAVAVTINTPFATSTNGINSTNVFATNSVRAMTNTLTGTNSIAANGGALPGVSNAPPLLGGAISQGRRPPRTIRPLSPLAQARVNRFTQSEILAPIFRPPPMALLGIAGRDAFIRTPSGQTTLLREGGEKDGIKLLRLGTNRVLIEQAGEKKELMIFNGFGSESLLPK
jgi:hypothetical protein